MVVSPEASLLDALRAIEAGHCAIALVCDRQGRLLGTVTDGDLRRAILRGAPLGSRALPGVMNVEFAAVDRGAGRAEVLDMMRARGIEQVPIVDSHGRLCGLHFLREMIGVEEHPNWAVIMAGGRGSRLGSLTDHVPKPMMAVAGRPILERLLLHLHGQGVRRIFVAVNYLAHVIENHFGDGSRLGCRIEYLREPAPAGTGGALALLPSRPRAPLLVVNGDLVTQFDVSRLLRFHARGGYAATLGVRPHSIEIPYGVARMRGSRLLGLSEKPSERVLVNAGIYVVEPRLLRLVPRHRPFHMTELLEHCLERRLDVGAHLIQDDWLDIGRRDELRRANGDL